MTVPEPVADLRAAGIVTRALAALIDFGVVLLILGGLYAGLVLVKLVYSPAGFSLPSLNYVFSTLVTFLVAVFYLTGCWTVSGCTAGAVTMGLRVVGRRVHGCIRWSHYCVRSAVFCSRSDCCGS